MSLRNTELIDKYQFSDLADLRDFLNQFKTTDLNAVHPEDGDYFVLDWYEETLSDGSKANNARIVTTW